ncbi:MAG: isoaspartyl peptidase/L-asparaginase [Candidatus Methylomirabilis sp.]|nr:isoaspartyl peptidase/L-asparaginase [Deltaproteobacteria bacterium]
MVILVHGGAGAKKPLKRGLGKIGEALKTGYAMLESGEAALDAVTGAIALLEDSGFFNAGEGSNIQLDGVRRLDAALMEGESLRAGSVIGLEGFRNPIRAAREAMGLPNNVFTNTGAARIAEKAVLPRIGPPSVKVLERLEMARKTPAGKLYETYFSTVGAIAMDREGNLAAGSSTGGVFAMLPGRVGDTPLIGSGVYADNHLGAVSCTGRGEDILRLCLAKEVSMLMGRRAASQTARAALKRLAGLGFQAGFLALDRIGRYAIAHTTAYMAAGVAGPEGVFIGKSFETAG